jgi:hypothetical protein
VVLVPFSLVTLLPASRTGASLIKVLRKGGSMPKGTKRYGLQ